MGGAPRHTSSITAGGTTQATSQSAPLSRVRGMPQTTLHAAVTMTAAAHMPANRPREISFNIAVSSFGLAMETRAFRKGASSNAGWLSSGKLDWRSYVPTHRPDCAQLNIAKVERQWW